MTKVLFSNPPWFQDGRQGVRAGSRWPFSFQGRSAPDRYYAGEYLPNPLFLAFACTHLQKAAPDATVLFRDSIAMRESYSRYYAYLQSEHFDYIVIESATPSWEHDRKVIEAIGRLCPQTKVILTGPIATVFDASWPVHACIKGESEKGVVRVVCGGESGLIDFDLMTEAEMNAAPFPYMDATLAHRYCDSNPVGQKFPHAQVWSSRGCPYKCCFCVWPSAMTGNDPDGTKPRTIRHYSKDYMLAWLTEWKEKYRFQSIYFDDDTFNIGQRHVKDMCAVMREIKLPWSAMCRADGLDRETWKEMKDSGCFGVKLGFESGSQYVIDKIVNKHLDLEAAAETLHYLADLGMSTHGTFTIGLPGETPAQQQETIAYIQRLYSLGMTTHQLSGTACIEGTPLATLLQVGKLDKYPGASVAGFDAEPDGLKKLEGMSR